MTGRPRFAFSLVELLVVMAIIGILTAVTFTAVNGVRSGRNLSTASDMVLDHFMLARQNALTKNARVRWQIVSVPDDRNGDASAFRRLQLEIFDAAARQWKPLRRPASLPLTIFADPARSTLLTNNAAGATNAVVFLSSGRTWLNPNGNYTLTLCDDKNTNNFITLQLDPLSGRCRTFQP